VATLHENKEPFLHPRLFDFTRSAKSKEFLVTMITNGTLIEEHSRAVIESWLDILRDSL
jgi:MoaA/NifB/PqqE/SkfB family radical SAM enzyme